MHLVLVKIHRILNIRVRIALICTNNRCSKLRCCLNATNLKLWAVEKLWIKYLLEQNLHRFGSLEIIMLPQKHRACMIIRLRIAPLVLIIRMVVFFNLKILTFSKIITATTTITILLTFTKSHHLHLSTQINPILHPKQASHSIYFSLAQLHPSHHHRHHPPHSQLHIKFPQTKKHFSLRSSLANLISRTKEAKTMSLFSASIFQKMKTSLRCLPCKTPTRTRILLSPRTTNFNLKIKWQLPKQVLLRIFQGKL